MHEKKEESDLEKMKTGYVLALNILEQIIKIGEEKPFPVESEEYYIINKALNGYRILHPKFSGHN